MNRIGEPTSEVRLDLLAKVLIGNPNETFYDLRLGQRPSETSENRDIDLDRESLRVHQHTVAVEDHQFEHRHKRERAGPITGSVVSLTPSRPQLLRLVTGVRRLSSTSGQIPIEVPLSLNAVQFLGDSAHLLLDEDKSILEFWPSGAVESR